MGMLADDVDHVIGVDTHRDAHTAAIVAVTGVVVAHRAEPANPFGYRRLLRFARRHAAGRLGGRRRLRRPTGVALHDDPHRYMVSRGLAKSGSRDPYEADDTTSLLQ